MSKKILIAGAGSGKTTYLINEALKISKEKKVLITTYTVEAEENLREKLLLKNGFIPDNIDIQSWFSFLIQHGIRPYQNLIFRELDKNKLKGLHFVQSKSGIKYKSSRGSVYYKDDKFNCYFDKNYRIYSDKVSKLTIKSNKDTGGKVLARLKKIYDYIFIDELQDMAGFDLEIIKELLKGDHNFIGVGDPRQTTYRTHYSTKNKNYRGEKILDFFTKLPKKIDIKIDEDTLSLSHRCNKEICDFSNDLYPNNKSMDSCDCCSNFNVFHQGVFFISREKLNDYLKKYNPIQLKWSKSVKINENYSSLNFGQSKGLTFERVIIYPTKKMRNWINDKNYKLPNDTRAKFYVGITRAKYSVTIVVDSKDKILNEKIKEYEL